jgi:cytosine/adenosine deaminase-related metal-dependent hydrolase
MKRAGKSTGSLDGARDDVKIVRARVVVPMAGEPIENGAVAIAGNQIAGVGRFEEIRASHEGEILDLGEQILLPGLINAHCHLDYTMLRGKIPRQQSFSDWISAINAHKAALQPEDYLTAIADGLAEAQNFGTTALVNLEAFPELLPRVQRPPLRTWWCAEMIDIRRPVPVREVTEHLCGWFQSHPEWLGGIGLAPHAPYTASARLYSEVSAVARERDLLLTTHLAESDEEMQMFRDATGPAFAFLKSIGRPMDDCGHETPLSSLMRQQELEEKWLIAHLNELTDSDFTLLAQCRKFHIAHCPRSHTFFGHAPFELRKLRRLGFNICLGTDSLASNLSLNLFAEMRELRDKEPWISPRELLMMITINAAHAIGQAGALGMISPGFQADLIAVPSAEPGVDVFDALVAFEGTVPWMMINGAVLTHHC